jgi:uncharacterized membrane protein YhaH (DUF805 family)
MTDNMSASLIRSVQDKSSYVAVRKSRGGTMSDWNWEVFLSIAGALPFVLLAIITLAIPARRLKAQGLRTAYRWLIVAAVCLLLYGPLREAPSLLSAQGSLLRANRGTFLLLVFMPGLLLLMTFISFVASTMADRKSGVGT